MRRERENKKKTHSLSSSPLFLPGTELEKGEPYHVDQKSFGHIGISVPNLSEAVAHFDKHGVKFVKRPEEGSMRDLAFIADPDGYWIEVIQADLMRQFAAGA